MAFCSECGNIVVNKFCPECGAASEPKGVKDSILYHIGLTIVVFIVTIFISGLVFPKDELNGTSVSSFNDEKESTYYEKEPTFYENGTTPSSFKDTNSADCSTRDNNFIINKMKQMNRDVISVQNVGNRNYFVQYVDWSSGTGNSGSIVLDYSNAPCD